MELLESDGQLSFGKARGALVVITHGRELGSSFTLARRHIDAAFAEHGAPIGVLYVVDHDEGPPEGYKQDIKELLAHTRSKLAAVSVAIMSKGFVAAVYRSVGTVVMSMGGQRDFVSFHGGVPEAAAWLTPRLSRGGSPRVLEDAVDELQRHRTSGR